MSERRLSEAPSGDDPTPAGHHSELRSESRRTFSWQKHNENWRKPTKADAPRVPRHASWSDVTSSCRV